MPKKWTSEDDAQLLGLILKMYAPKIDYDEVAARFGHDVTAVAIRHRIRKYKGAASNHPSVQQGKTTEKMGKKMDSDVLSDDEYERKVKEDEIMD